MTDQANKWKYTLKFCEGVEGQEAKDIGVLQTSVNKSSDTHIVGRISATDIKTGGEYPKT